MPVPASWSCVAHDVLTARLSPGSATDSEAESRSVAVAAAGGGHLRAIHFTTTPPAHVIYAPHAPDARHNTTEHLIFTLPGGRYSTHGTLYRPRLPPLSARGHEALLEGRPL